VNLTKNATRALMLASISCLVLLFSGAVYATISIATVPVGNAGNAPDNNTGSLYGEVDYNYSVDKYDVTNAQYAAFLNAVAATDTYGLYDPGMASSFPNGISRSGSSGSFAYGVVGNPNYPVTPVTFWDSTRFANWLENGQPTGPEGPGTTETGTYTLTASGIADNTVTRNANSIWAITSENEWYKAAYYSPTTHSYYTYATQSNNAPSNVLSATATNNANYYAGGFTDSVNVLTPVGAFAASPSAYGTYDQTGDLFDWNETIGGSTRDLRGGAYGSTAFDASSAIRANVSPTNDNDDIGFRLVELAPVPEPASLGIVTVVAVGFPTMRRRVRAVGRSN
jgi:sulfatase modifying factor 1